MADALLIEAKEEVWPLKQVFRISRGSRTETRVVVVSVTHGDHVGRGECVPIGRYNQTCASVIKEIQSIQGERDLDRQRLQQFLPAGAARNALDCALWDLEAKRAGKRVWDLAAVEITPRVQTAFTISLDTPQNMMRAAGHARRLPLLKLKLGGDDVDIARVKAVRSGASDSRLIIDANESWSPEHYEKIADELKQLGVGLIEQPFPAGADEVLENLDHPIPVCADESCHTSADLLRLRKRYDAVNVKLDKTGGLTEALRLGKAARANGFKLLIGCMVGTSLSMAPARVLASSADYVDLDGPLLLTRDREDPLPYDNGDIGLPSADLWG